MRPSSAFDQDVDPVQAALHATEDNDYRYLAFNLQPRLL